MKQLTTVLQRRRRVLLALGYLLVLVCAVMYLRVTISVPPEGDDRLTLNRWLYDFERMPFWQYLLQDLQERLRYFTLDQVRFFPFHYPSAFSLLFFGTLSSYRLYIIGVTAAAAFLTGRVAARLARSEALALGAFTLTLALAPIFNEGMYSYYAVPQKTLFWAMAAWLCLLRLQDTGRRRWGAAAAVLAFLSCGTYEEGYMYAALAALVWVTISYMIAIYSTVRLAQPFPAVELSEQAIETILGVNVLKVLENIFEHNDGPVFGTNNKKTDKVMRDC